MAFSAYPQFVWPYAYGGGQGGTQGVGAPGSSSPNSSGGVSPAGTTGDIGLGTAGRIGTGLLGAVTGIGAPVGIGVNGAITAANVANQNSDLNSIGAQPIGLLGALSAFGNSLTAGRIGTSAAQQAAMSALGTPAAMGIGIPTGSVDMASADTTNAADVGNGIGPSGSAPDTADHSGDTNGTGGGSAPGGPGPGDAGGDNGSGGGDNAKGGIIKKVRGAAPKGSKDDGWITAQRGEGVLNRGATHLIGPGLLNLLNAAGSAPNQRGLLNFGR